MDAAAAADLHLDDIARLCARGHRAWLGPVYLTPLRDPDAVAFRQEVFADLAAPDLRRALTAFSEALRAAAGQADHARALVYRHERNWWLAEAARTYCVAVADVLAALHRAAPRSRALLAARDALQAHAASDAHVALAGETASVTAGLAAVRYRLEITESALTVSRADESPDFGAEIIETFARFRQPGAGALPVDVFRTSDMNTVEVGVLERVVRLYPAPFAALDRFAAHAGDCIDPGVAALGAELDFYIAYLEAIEPLAAAGLAFCLPTLTTGAAGFDAAGLVDLALACKRPEAARHIVTNDLAVRAGERRVVITGANQGGKTTLARAIGQLHHLAAIGVPVPARSATLGLAPGVHTLFERRDDDVLGGGLTADLERARRTVDALRPDSLVILNELFSAATVHDALALSRAVLARIEASGARCVVVTFLSELAADPDVASLVAEPNDAEPAGRTFRFARRPPDGIALAKTIADRHGLGYASVRERLAQ